jgi:hypothetical protein
MKLTYTSILLMLALFSTPLFAGEQSLNTTPLWLGADTMPEDVEQVLTRDVIGFMKAYVPAGYGNTIKGYDPVGTGSWSNASMKIEKGFPIGDIDIYLVVKSASKVYCNGIQGYSLYFNLMGSESRVSEEARGMRIDMCFRKKNDGSFELGAKSYLIEGDDFGGKTGKVVKSFLGGQHWPLMLAIEKRIKHFRNKRLN